MINIPAGPCFLGLTKYQKRQGRATGAGMMTGAGRWAKIGREVEVSTYWIAKFPVTNRDYATYVSALGRRPPQHWNGPQPPADLLHHPVVWVSYPAVLHYIDWLREETRLPARLPTPGEWEKAARGTDQRLFPWGDEPEDGRCHIHSRTTAPVTKYVPMGDSPYGVSDMAGNVREWTHSDDGRVMDVRGGGFLARQSFELWCAYSDVIVTDAKASIGFRIAYST
jgi:formylglycine-generating enzyme required for sulfatase activity